MASPCQSNNYINLMVGERRSLINVEGTSKLD